MKFLADNGKSEWADVMAHEIELLSRKSSKSSTPTAAQKDSIAVSEIIKDILSENERMTVGAILKDERIKAYVRHNGESVSSQMVTAIFTKNTADFSRVVDKKIAYYSLNYGIAEDTEVEGE